MKILNFLNLGENGTKEFLQDHGGSAVMFATDMLGHLDVQYKYVACLVCQYYAQGCCHAVLGLVPWG